MTYGSYHAPIWGLDLSYSIAGALRHRLISERPLGSYGLGFRCVSHPQCESQNRPRCIGRNLRFRAPSLRASQLASTTRGDSNRSDRRGKIGEKIVDLSRRQSHQELSNRARPEPSGREAGRRRHENTRRNLQDR
jgi:hypothetical protein